MKTIVALFTALVGSFALTNCTAHVGTEPGGHSATHTTTTTPHYGATTTRRTTTTTY